MSDGRDEMASVVTCPACKKKFRWQVNVAGKKVRCGCGQVMEMPTVPPTPTRIVPTNNEQPEKKEKHEKPRNNAPPQPTEQAPALGGLYAQAMGGGTTAVQRALDDREDEVQLSMWRERHVPIAMIVAGIIAQYLGWSALTSMTNGLTMGEAMVGATVESILQIVLYLPLAVGGTFVAASLLGTGFGGLWTTTLKLAALMFFPIAVVDIVFFSLLVDQEFDYRVLVLGVALYLLLSAPAIWLLFETDLNETIILAGIHMAPRFAAVFLLLLPAKSFLLDS